MAKFLTFGEIMLRLKTLAHERFFQSPSFEATFGGGEANVAVSLSNYGLDAGFVSALPANDIGDAAIRELRKFDVDTSSIRRSGSRLGIYFLETGSNQRPSKVVYDRAQSAICEAAPGDFDWESIFDGAKQVVASNPVIADHPIGHGRSRCVECRPVRLLPAALCAR